MKMRFLITGLVAMQGSVAWAGCPGITQPDMQGVSTGEFTMQFELAEYQAAANCTISYNENPDIASLNDMIQGQGALPTLGQRLPEEPLVIIPFDSIGKYGGTFEALSNATESGTSDFLSMRHGSLFRYSNDLQQVVPHVAKSWAWNDDFTQLTVTLRKGHKWSDGADFTADDVKFWYDNLMMDANVIPNPKDYALAGGEPMVVEVIDPQTVAFNLAAPRPGLMETFSSSFIPPYQPKHFLGQFHPAVDNNADANAQALGYENGYEAIKAFYGNSDWTDTPSPLLTASDRTSGFPKAVVPSLESHVLVRETAEGRHFVANPYYFLIDTAGNQLPYISEQNETYVDDPQVRLLKLINGEVTYKAQSVQLNQAPVLLDNSATGDYSISFGPGVGFPALSFNVTSEDAGKREIFGNLDFRTAMSIAINRDEINEVAFFGEGKPIQYTGMSPLPDFVDEKWETHEISHDQQRANALLDGLGLVDQNGDGQRDLPNGDPFVLNFQFSTQSVSSQVIELIAQNWANVGIASVVKEITADEYRSAQSANKLDIAIWKTSLPFGATLGSNENFVPPFGTFFTARTGMLWAEWMDSDGANGVEPPEWVKGMVNDINALQSAQPGSSKQHELADNLVSALTSNLLMMGIVKAPEPVYKSNDLQNVADFTTVSYEFYRTYPYIAPQWWISKD